MVTTVPGKYHYDLLKESLTRELNALEKYSAVNEFLISNDWLFVSPLFFQGIELGYFSELSKKPGDHKESIKALIFRKFYNLNWSAGFIEGYCKRCKHIEPFLQSIEHSLILTYQKDYEGGIKTLIPIIEGILRKYLVLDKNVNKKITFDDLTKSFDSLEHDLVDGYRTILLNYKDQNNYKVDFTGEQIEELMLLQSKYYNKWFSFTRTFISQSFYFKTHGQAIGTKLNRHAVLHEFGQNISYNLENYIKVYFVIQFLTWAFIHNENKSILNEIEGMRFFEKAISYKNIILLAEKASYEKHLLYKEYANYDPNLLKEEFKVILDLKIPKTTMALYNFKRVSDRFLWKKGSK